MGDPQKTSLESDVESEEHFELDLDQHAGQDLNEAFEEAVAAVDLADRGNVADEPEADEPKADEPEEVEDPEDSGGLADPDVERLRAENRALKERLMRTLADFDNFRKRTEREKQSLGRFAIFDVVKDFLPVIDNLERALAASGKLEDLKLGLEMVTKQQEDMLGRHGVKRIESVGKAFDPTIHQAVSREESEDVEEPMVESELQRGYLLYERLLRPAMVTVVVPTASPEGPTAEEEVDAGDEDEGRGEVDGAEEEAEEKDVREEVGQLTE